MNFLNIASRKVAEHNNMKLVEDYYDNESNEGHIMIKLSNEGDKDIHLNAGDKFCQMLFMQYGITYDDNAEGLRTGGFGSTGK